MISIQDILLIFLCVTVATMIAFPNFYWSNKPIRKVKKMIVKYFKKV